VHHRNDRFKTVEHYSALKPVAKLFKVPGAHTIVPDTSYSNE